MRESVAHKGYILETDYDEAAAIASSEPSLPPYSERLNELIGKVAIFRNLMVKCLLRMLDYSGTAVDARRPQQPRKTNSLKDFIAHLERIVRQGPEIT